MFRRHQITSEIHYLGIRLITSTSGFINTQSGAKGGRAEKERNRAKKKRSKRFKATSTNLNVASFFFRGHEGDDVVDRGLVRAALSEVIVRPHFLEKQEAPRGGRFEREEASVDAVVVAPARASRGPGCQWSGFER